MLFKDNYSVAIWSWESLPLDIVYELLNLKSVRRLVFPARLPVAPKKELRLSEPKEFDLALVPKVFKKGLTLTVPLIGENGFELNLNINYERSIIPSSFILGIPLGAAQEREVSWHDLRDVFMEVIPVFRSDQGRLFYSGPNRDEEILYGEPKDYWVDITLEWISYYGPKALEIIGRERFDRLVTCKEKVPLHGGILIVLQEEPLDMTNPEHVARKLQAEHELGFDELAKDEKRVWRREPVQVSSTGNTPSSA